MMTPIEDTKDNVFLPKPIRPIPRFWNRNKRVPIVNSHYRVIWESGTRVGSFKK